LEPTWFTRALSNTNSLEVSWHTSWSGLPAVLASKSCVWHFHSLQLHLWLSLGNS
jgi:hypothetical protein